jgi:hypothetical protein
MARPFEGDSIPEAITKAKRWVQHCPLTCNLPTRMTRAGWERSCAAERRRQEVRGEEWGTYGHKAQAKVKTRCQQCQGRTVPAEITLITLEETMGGQCKIKKGTCAICGDLGVLKSNHKLDVCTNCAAIQANINMRPQAVLKALGIMRPELLERAVRLVPDVQVEAFEEMERLAALVGYAGQDGDELLDRVELVIEQLAHEAAQWTMAGDMAIDLSQPDAHLAAAVNQEDVALLTQAFDQYKERCEELENNLALANNKLAQAQADKGYFATYIDDIRQTLDLPGDFPADKIAFSVAMLRDELQAAAEQLELPISRQGSALDSHLLDLALDAMRGRITGLDPDQLAMLREAA